MNDYYILGLGHPPQVGPLDNPASNVSYRVRAYLAPGSTQPAEVVRVVEYSIKSRLGARGEPHTFTRSGWFHERIRRPFPLHKDPPKAQRDRLRLLIRSQLEQAETIAKARAEALGLTWRGNPLIPGAIRPATA